MQYTFTQVRTRSRWLLGLFASLWLTTSAFAQTSTFSTAQIEEGTGCDWPFSALAARPSDGKIFGLWRKGSGAQTTYKLIQWDGSSWSTLSTFAPTGSGNSSVSVPNFDSATDDVDIAVDATGRFHVVFRGSRGDGLTSTRGVWYGLSTNGTSWSFTEIQTFSDPNGWQDTNDPVIEVDATNQPHIGFIYSNVNTPRTYGIRYYRYTGSAWVGETALTQTGGSPANEVNNFDMAIDGTGKAHLAIQRETNNLGRNGGLVYTTNSLGSWATPTVLAEGAQDQTQGNTLGIATDVNNKVYVVYSGYPGQINYIDNTSGNFSAPQQINGNVSGSVIDGSFRINSNGTKSFGYNSSGLRFAYQPSGASTWTTALAYTAPAGASAGTFPSAILSSSGRVMLLFDNLTTGSGSCSVQNTRKLWYATATVTSNTPAQVAPTVTTSSASAIATTSAMLGGNVTADGGATITGRGVVYSSTNTNPTVGGSGVTSDANGTNTGSFSETITGLAAGTTYYVRAYAINSVGTSCGSVISFTTPTTISSITRASTASTNASTVSYAVQFTSSVSGLSVSNFSLITTGVTGANVASVSGSGGNYTVTVNTGSGSGTLGLNLNNTTGISPAVSNAPFTGEVYTIDKTAPTISSVSVPANGTYRIGQRVDVTVNLSETVTVTGTPQLAMTIGSTVRQASYLSGSGTATLVFGYTIQGGDLDSDGIELASTLTLNGGALRDAAGNNVTLTFGGVPSTTGLLVDGIAPTVSGSNRQNLNGQYANAGPLTFRVSFSENVTGLTPSAFTLMSTGTATGSVVSVTPVAGNTNQYDISVSNVSGDGTLRLDVKSSGSGITDVAGNTLNGGFTGGQTFIIDQTPPMVTISSSAGANGGSTRNSPIPFTVTFSESVTGFVADDVVVTNGSISSVTGGGDSYYFTVAPSANGAVVVNVGTRVAQDIAGNGNPAISPFRIDYLPLTLTGFSALNSSVCTGSPLSFTATVSNTDAPYAYTLTNGTSLVTGTSMGGTAFSRTLTTAGSGMQSFTLVVTDASQRVSASQSVTVNTLPVVSITGLASAYCQDTPAVTLTGNPAGMGGSFTIDGTSASMLTPLSLTVGQHAVTYRFTDGNGCSSSTSQNVVIKATPPVASLLTQSDQSYPASQSAVTVDLNTGNVILVASGCTGTVNWTGPSNTAGTGTTIIVPTSQAGLFTYQASCTIDGCTGPLATAIVRVEGRLTVLHRDVDNYADNNAIQPLIQIQNQGAGALPLSKLTLRYDLTVENAATLGNLSISYAQMGSQNVRLRYVALNPVQQGASSYVEYSFTDGAGSLAVGANSGSIQTYLTRSDYGTLYEPDDYSYASVRDQLVGNVRITAYYDGVMISGVEPGSTAQIRAVRALTESKNGSSATQLNTYLEVRNEGNVAINYSDLKVRYYFTSEGMSPLTVELDYTSLGGGAIQPQFVRLNTPLANADTYLELRFANGGQLAPGASTGLIRYRVIKSDYSYFNQDNDYSYQVQPENLSQNSRVVVYAGAERIWGQEPGASSRAALAEAGSELSVTVLGNPVRDELVSIEVRGAGSQPLQLWLLTPQGKVVGRHQVANPQSTERHQFLLGGQAGGMYLLQVSTPTQSRTVKVLKAN